LDVAVQTSNCTFDASRFALELFVIPQSRQSYDSKTTSFIDDQYTPGEQSN